jgi:ankyrin repeat protein
VESKDEGGRTPLLMATKCGSKAVVRLLVEKGADADSKDQDGQTALSLATEHGHEGMIQLLSPMSRRMEVESTPD